MEPVSAKVFITGGSVESDFNGIFTHGSNDLLVSIQIWQMIRFFGQPGEFVNV
jgi:hypothetical protein